jgi:hypothetical protein
MSAMTRRLILASTAFVLIAGLGGCVAGVGYDGDVAVGYSPGYVEPFGYDYGGWGGWGGGDRGGGYHVGPGRGGDRRAAPGPSHGYRAAPQSRSVPSIPHGSGGSRGHR